MVRQVEDQQGPHTVETESLPHFGGEQSGKLTWMAEPGCVGVIDMFGRLGRPVRVGG